MVRIRPRCYSHTVLKLSPENLLDLRERALKVERVNTSRDFCLVLQLPRQANLTTLRFHRGQCQAVDELIRQTALV